MLYHGLRVMTSVYLTEAGAPVQVRRTWRERLLTWPWRPWRATRTVVPQVPMRGGYQLADGTLLFHPLTLEELKFQHEIHGGDPGERPV